MRYAIPTYRLGYRTDPQGAADLTLSQGEQRSLMRELGQRSGQALEALGQAWRPCRSYALIAAWQRLATQAEPFAHPEPHGHNAHTP
jgi:hypothetical protein